MSDWWAREGVPLIEGTAEVGTDDLTDSGVTTAKINDSAVTTAKINDDAVTQAKVADNTLDGTVVGSVAASNTEGGIAVLHYFDASTGLTGDTDITLTHKTRVLDMWALATAAGGVGDTFTLKSTDGTISNALDMQVSDTDVVRSTSLDDDYHEVAAGNILRLTGASAATGYVYVLGMRVA